jgi:hypothetical protein
MDLEHLTHQGHWKTAITRLYKRVFFFDSFAKNTAVGSIGHCNSYPNRLICSGDQNEANIFTSRERPCF